MTDISRNAGAEERLNEALYRAEAFLAIVLAERTGPLTSLQRDMLHSAQIALIQTERLLAELLTTIGPHPQVH